MLTTLRQLLFRRPQRGDLGATATEYAILVGFMVFAMILGLTLFGNALNDRFSTMATVVSAFN